MEKEMDKKFFEMFFGVSPEDRAIPSFRKSLDLDQVILLRAKEIASRHKKVYLLWSGGIDSTLVFYALSQTILDIIVVYNKNSIAEYPKLGKELLENKYSNVEMLHVSKFTKEARDEYPTITGELGDQMVGSATFVKFNQPDRLKQYDQILPTPLIEGFSDRVKEVLQKESFTAGEYLWALNFIFKYNDVTKRIDTEEFFKGCRLVHFFEYEEFEIWAMNNYTQNSSYNKFKDYKMAYKNYIFSKNGDEIYRDHKIKVPSLCMATME